jgi:xylulokinase
LYLGIDLGTSAVKILLVEEEERVIAQASVPLEVQRPRPLWSEQDPESWWRATCGAIQELRRSHPRELARVRGIGLSGQMHGATLLDERDRVLRPAILWNDGRSSEACAELERRIPAIVEITGNAVMPGFTAPKLVWLAEHEPETFARVAKVLLPKDYLRLRLSGDHASEMSDAAGTLWLDVAARAWSEALLEATGLRIEAMPRLHEGSQATGRLRPQLSEEWSMRSEALIAGGAGDNAAGAVGVGVVEPGRALLSLGTSGVYFVASDAFAPNPAGGG